MGKPVEVRVLSRAGVGPQNSASARGKQNAKNARRGLPAYFDPAFLLAAHRAFISSDSFRLPAGVRVPRFLFEDAVLVPPALLLAAQRAFISWESFRRPAGVICPFFFAGAGDFPPLSLAQRALAAAESLARVEGEK
jgi:hypothetical protein